MEIGPQSGKGYGIGLRTCVNLKGRNFHKKKHFSAGVKPPTGTIMYLSATMTQSEFWIDIRPYFDYYEAPDFLLLLAAVKKAFPNDPKIIVS